MKTAIAVLKSLRPQQWIKNLFIFAPLLFAQKMLETASLVKTGLAFLSFCALSGSVYIFNDLNDLDEDRLHAVRSKRPLASGQLKQTTAGIVLVIFAAAGLASAAALDRNFFFISLFYLLLQVAYSLRLKNIVILDIFIVAAGFLIRVVAGGLVIHVYISSWLLICSALLALFLAIGKRRHELSFLKDGAGSHRPILREYSVLLLDQMISVVTASTLLAYCLYTISEETVAKFGTRNLIFTIPFVLYGIFRYLYLIHKKAGGGTPETLILKDKPLLLDVFLWIASSALILYLR